MNPNYLGLVALCLSLLVFWVVQTLLRVRPARIRVFWLLFFSILAIPSFLFAFYYAHLLPEWEWFYELRSIHGSEFLVVFLGAALGTGASLLHCRLRGFLLLALLALGGVPYLKPFLRPLPEMAFRDRWKGNACLQSTSSTCGPAAVCTILRYLGYSATEREVARAAYSGSTGTEAWYLARYVREKGFTAQFRFGNTVSPQTELPAVVGVRFGGVGHFIAVLKMEDGDVIFVDPLVGEERLPLDSFLKRYQFTRFSLWIGK